ncbi:hypothetical protein BASA81_001481 [Batrachochytrium salamandrivorans]|nr:hypothetical protein BASA81_001481 [Batrachochytrium salamandrivorans]
MRRKVLLLGQSKAGKSSMRAVVFSNCSPELTSRLGPTCGAEPFPVKLVSGVVINLLDFGKGGEHLASAHLSTCSAVVYVFGLEVEEADLVEFEHAMAQLPSQGCGVFVMLNKRDGNEGRGEEELRMRILARIPPHLESPTLYCTSIYNSSLIEAWSGVVQFLLADSKLNGLMRQLGHVLDANHVVLIHREYSLVLNQTNAPQWEFAHQLKTFRTLTGIGLQGVESHNAQLIGFTPGTLLLLEPPLGKEDLVNATLAAFLQAKHLVL